MPTRSRMSRPLSARLSSSQALAGLWITLLVVLEVAGRRSDSDFADAVVLALLAVATGLTLLYHRHRHVPWVAALLRPFRRLAVRLGRHVIVVGIDFRGEPSIPRATPRIVSIPPLALLLLLSIVIVGTWLGPIDVRGLAHQTSLVLFAVLLGSTWLAALLLLVASVLFPILLFHEFFVAHASAPHRTRQIATEIGVCLAYLTLPFVVGGMAPPWIAVATFLTAFALVPPMAWLHMGREPVFLWRAVRGGPVAAVTSRRLRIVHATSLILLHLLVAFAMLGPHAWPGHVGDVWDTDLKITRCLGLTAAWFGAAATIVLSIFALGFLRRLRSLDPARHVAPTVQIHGSPGEAERSQATRTLEGAGFRVTHRPTRRRSGTEVDLDLVPESESTATRFEERVWPWRIAQLDLERPEVLRILNRRDQLQRRRQFHRGLERLLKLARRHRYRRGSGYWISPHYVFIHGLSRDQDDDDSEPSGWPRGSIIGPPYHLLFPHASRSHLREVLDALEVDVVFAADGVRFKELRQVFSVLFETYDIHGGAQRAEERHFIGLPRLRVVLDDFELDQTRGTKSYPEPDYEDLGRARILFVFRDREEHETSLSRPAIPALTGR